MTRISVFSQSLIFVSLSLWVVTPQDSHADEDAASQLQQSEQKRLDELAKFYRLNENQLIRRFVPPFPKARDAFVDMRFDDRAKFVKSCRFYWDKEHLVFCNASLFIPVTEGSSAPPEQAATFASTIHVVTGTPRSRMVGRLDLLEKRIVGDFVWRRSAERNQLSAELAKLFAHDLKVPLRLEYVTTPLDAIIISNQRSGDEEHEGGLSLAINGLNPRVGIGREEGGWKDFVTWLETALSMPIVDDTQGLESRKIVWKYDTYRPTKEELKPGWTLDVALEKSRGEILQRLSKQLSVSFQVERRPMFVLEVSVQERRSNQ